ncbi:MAG TPA: 3-deoxy-8-phosphooctulonate synthase, partial [Alphaproteobacteria bacterium]|nr:3-deoxy-8-phosphooctulonate synthase [Alphaproteobacteria bacterium]
MPGDRTSSRHVKVGPVTFGNDLPMVLIAGECQIEKRKQTFEVAEELTKIADEFGIGLVYKSSFDKANRTSIKTNRGVGMREGLEILAEVRKEYGCPVLTDVHEPDQCDPTAEKVDILQIPAFLCRQTD